MSSTTAHEALAKAWAYALERISNTWLYNCDSDDSHSFCNRSAHIETPWMVIYQPSAIGYCRMLDDDPVGNIIIRRIDGKPITAGFWKKAQPYIEEVNKLYLQSYNDILEITDNKWIESCNGSIRSLLHTKKDLQLDDDGVLKYKFNIAPHGESCCGVAWTPHRVVSFRTGAPIVLPTEDELDVYDTPTTRAVV